MEKPARNDVGINGIYLLKRKCNNLGVDAGRWGGYYMGMEMRKVFDSEEIPRGKGLARSFLIKPDNIDPRTGEEPIDDPLALLILALLNKVKEMVKKR